MLLCDSQCDLSPLLYSSGCVNLLLYLALAVHVLWKTNKPTSQAECRQKVSVVSFIKVDFMAVGSFVQVGCSETGQRKP